MRLFCLKFEVIYEDLKNEFVDILGGKDEEKGRNEVDFQSFFFPIEENMLEILIYVVEPLLNFSIL